MLLEWLSAAIPKFRRCKTDLSQRDDELLEFNNDLLENEIEILALLMVNEWLEPQINSELYVSQFYGGKEEKLRGFSTSQLAIYGNGIVYSFEYAGKPLES